jgi:hypothetical protein
MWLNAGQQADARDSTAIHGIARGPLVKMVPVRRELLGSLRAAAYNTSHH